MARRKEAAHGGGHGWFVTFADLMGLLVAFFVMLVAFSSQDSGKMAIVAGSMREAFGVQIEKRFSGIIEVDGLPTRQQLKNVQKVQPDESSPITTPEDKERERFRGARLDQDRAFALAAASLRQAMQEMPDLTEISKHIMIEETRNGLNIEIVDQDGRSMFPEGAKEPYDRTRRVVQKLASKLKTMPYRVAIAGHTSASRQPPRPGYGPWELSADRANAIRQILEDEGMPTTNVLMVSGRADTQPLFPDDPFIAANRRVTITLMHEEPPLPVGFKP